MMRGNAGLTILTLGGLLSGCVQTSQLYSVEQFGRPRYADNDRPRVSIGVESSRQVAKQGDAGSYVKFKESFRHFLSVECTQEALQVPAPKVDGEPVAKQGQQQRPDQPKSWIERNPRSAGCVGRVAAYAVDQCVFITLHQNEFAATVNLTIGAVAVGSALATTAYAFHGSSNDRTAATALAGSVAANGGGRGFLPSNTFTPVKGMIESAAPYAEATGLDDTRDFYKDLHAAPKDGGSLKLARIHDAVLSNCTANAYGLGPGRTKH